MDRSVIEELARIVGPDNLSTAPEDLSCYSYDGTGQIFLPQAVAFPQSAQEISAILKAANKHGFPVVPRGAGSGMTGGSLPVRGGLVLVTSRMNRILEIDRDNMIAVVEPGVITGDLQVELKKSGLMYPPDPASLKFCTIGGNAAECAGGPSAVKYGVTKDYVLGIEVVLPTGDIMQTGVRTEKGVVGYDLTRLFIGSEGTLGIFTRLILRLLPLPEIKATFLLTFPSLNRATELVTQILGAGISPCTLEYMDRTAISIVRSHIPLNLPAETAALILLEVDGTDREVKQQTQQVEQYLQENAINFRRAHSSKDHDELWAARRSISPATFSLKPHKISEDIVVPRSKIPALVNFAEELARSLDLVILTFGHAGDGNIHVNIMVDRENEQEYTRGLAARTKLFEFVIGQGGTMSGEHGVGITKSPFLSLELDHTAIELMQRIKHLFDPNSVLNPGKILPEP
ncbi:MAG: FAD-binding protein [Desulfobulbaceae bacterium]|nr:FAD-binding protein [Desulfobulbaceae bacterium]